MTRHLPPEPPESDHPLQFNKHRQTELQKRKRHGATLPSGMENVAAIELQHLRKHGLRVARTKNGLRFLGGMPAMPATQVMGIGQMRTLCMQASHHTAWREVRKTNDAVLGSCVSPGTGTAEDAASPSTSPMQPFDFKSSSLTKSIEAALLSKCGDAQSPLFASQPGHVLGVCENATRTLHWPLPNQRQTYRKVQAGC